jgi:phosphatidylserine/phosphatidylglycerophosphate/cardiolipin synthase-like enzyme
MRGVRGIATAEIAKLLEALRAGLIFAPVTKAALEALHLRGLSTRHEAFARLGEEAVLALLEAVLEERATPRALIDLVWSGPEGKSGWASPTAAVVRDLFDKAERSVLLAGYSFDHGKDILEPLHVAMTKRRATVDIYLDVATARRDVTDLDAYVQNEVSRFLSTQWPWTPKPSVLVDPRTAAPASAGQHASMHAKCIVVDERWSLVGSANFTNRGQTRNIEVGALVDDVGLARAIASQFRAATAEGVFRSWLGGP